MVSVLGAPRCRVGPTEVEFTRLPALVLAALVHARRGLVDRDSLSIILWGNTPPAAAAGSLRVHVAAVRKCLRQAGFADPIATRAGGWSLNLPDDAVDLWWAEILLDRARDARRRSRLEEAVATAEEAAKLLDAPLLDGVRVPLALDQLHHLASDLRERAVDLAIECSLDLGDAEAWARLITVRFDDDPSNERRALQAVRTAYLMGQHPESSRIAQRHRTELAERGLVPSADFGAVELAVLNHELAPPANSRRELPFVGRNDHLDMLREALQIGSEVRVVRICGASGVGKTRLVREAIHRYSGGRRVMHATGSPSDSVPLASLVAALGDRVRWDTLELDGPMDPIAQRMKVFQAVHSELIRALGDDGILVVDVAHMLGADSKEAVRLVAADSSERRVVLLETTDVSSDSGRENDSAWSSLASRRLEVGGLNLEESALLLQSGGVALDEALSAQDLQTITDGLPFHLVSLVRSASQGRVLPASLNEVIDQRIDHLDHTALDVARHAAFIDGSIPLGLLLETTELEPRELVRNVDTLVASAVLGITNRSDEYEFEHALVRQRLLDMTPPARAALIALNSGRALLRNNPQSAAAIRHLVAAGSLLPAGELAGDASVVAMGMVSRGSFEAAQEMFDIADASNTGDVITDIRISSVRAALDLIHGQGTAATADLERQLHRAIEIGSDELTVTLLAWASTLGRASEDPALLDTMRSLCDRLRRRGDVTALSWVLFSMSSHLRLGPHREEARRVSDELDSLAAARNEPLLTAHAAQARHHALFVEAAPVAERILITDEMERVAAHTGELFTPSMASLARVNDALSAGAAASARTASEGMRGHVAASPWPLGVFLCDAIDICLRMLDDQLEGLDEAISGLATRGRELNVAVTDFTVAGQLFVLRWAQGRLDEVEGLVSMVAAANPTLPIWQHGHALALSEGGKAAAARRVLGPALSATLATPHRDWLWLPEAMLAAEVTSRLGTITQCRRLVAVLEQHADLDVVIAEGSVASLGPVGRPLAVLLARIGKMAEASRLAEAVEESIARNGTRMWARVGWRWSPTLGRIVPDR